MRAGRSLAIPASRCCRARRRAASRSTRRPRRRRAAAELLDGEDAARILVEHAVTGLALTAAGLVAGARDLTATYIKGRTQFGRALAEFQAVAMQIADVYIASRTIDLAAENAAWRVGSGLDATDDLAVAAYWICAEGPKTLRTCHHLHGGMGVDITYPLSGYFSWVTDIGARPRRRWRATCRSRTPPPRTSSSPRTSGP